MTGRVHRTSSRHHPVHSGHHCVKFTLSWNTDTRRCSRGVDLSVLEWQPSAGEGRSAGIQAELGADVAVANDTARLPGSRRRCASAPDLRSRWTACSTGCSMAIEVSKIGILRPTYSARHARRAQPVQPRAAHGGPEETWSSLTRGPSPSGIYARAHVNRQTRGAWALRVD
jgi:hypothetical protein